MICVATNKSRMGGGKHGGRGLSELADAVRKTRVARTKTPSSFLRFKTSRPLVPLQGVLQEACADHSGLAASHMPDVGRDRASSIVAMDASWHLGRPHGEK